MSEQFLPIHLENARLDAEELLSSVLDSNTNLDRILQLGRYRRVEGICWLFLDASATVLIENLRMNGRAFLDFLAHPGTSEDEKVTSRADCLFDAIVGSDSECIQQIAESSRRTWNSEEEYEDDFLYVRFLLDHLVLGKPRSECEEILGRYEGLLEGERDARFDVCQALLSDDAVAFDEALQDLLAEYQDLNANLISQDLIPPEVGLTEGKVCMEGAALLKLAQSMGLESSGEYLQVPLGLRQTIDLPADAEGWKLP